MRYRIESRCSFHHAWVRYVDRFICQGCWLLKERCDCDVTAPICYEAVPEELVDGTPPWEGSSYWQDADSKWHDSKREDKGKQAQRSRPWTYVRPWNVYSRQLTLEDKLML